MPPIVIPAVRKVQVETRNRRHTHFRHGCLAAQAFIPQPRADTSAGDGSCMLADEC